MQRTAPGDGWLCAAAIVLALSGCGGPTTYHVTGAVTYDGQPVERGDISFVPVDGGASPDGGSIENGQFSLAVTPGRKRVEIRGSRPLPANRQTQPEMGLMYEDYIPEIYNRRTTLTVEVGADSRKFDFPLAAP